MLCLVSLALSNSSRPLPLHILTKRDVPCHLQVMMTLGKALEIEADESQRGSYWLVLSKKRSTDIVGGELCLGFEVAVLDPQQYHQVGQNLVQEVG